MRSSLDLARFVYNEHRCCPWESFALEMEPFAESGQGLIRLRYIAGSEGKPILVEAFEKLREASVDPQAHARLLAALGNFDRISTDNKASFYAQVSGPAPVQRSSTSSSSTSPARE